MPILRMSTNTNEYIRLEAEEKKIDVWTIEAYTNFGFFILPLSLMIHHLRNTVSELVFSRIKNANIRENIRAEGRFH